VSGERRPRGPGSLTGVRPEGETRGRDVAIVGGGIAGTSLAALLAEAGARVRLYEREGIAAAASGRNSGVLQHPLDEALTAVYARSLALYRTLGHGFAYPGEPCGVLVLGEDPEPLRREHDELATRFPEVAPRWLEGAELRAAEPGLGEGLYAIRLETGRPVPPASATRAWADRARAAGAELRIGVAVESVGIVGGRVAGVRTAGGLEPAGAVVLAAGPWSAALAPLGVAPLWGVNVEVRLPDPPRHVLEQGGIDTFIAGGGGDDSLFSVVTADGVSAVGSTFMPEEPDPAALAPLLLERGARYLSALGDLATFSARACPRPATPDSRPLLGPHGDVDGLHVISGHGAWGISLGPGSAELVAGAILGNGTEIPPELAASRAV
jgi:glycine/D-amino acid oxidase-like deaminating enzyme